MKLTTYLHLVSRCRRIGALCAFPICLYGLPRDTLYNITLLTGPCLLFVWHLTDNHGMIRWIIILHQWWNIFFTHAAFSDILCKIFLFPSALFIQVCIIGLSLFPASNLCIQNLVLIWESCYILYVPIIEQFHLKATIYFYYNWTVSS